MTRREAVLTCYLLAGLGGVFASYIASAAGFEAYIAGAGLLVLFVAGIVYFEVTG
jgi:UDP-GlcNAc:undecaprenyl-phosphate GlcNAc-1-phosphate transferase